MKTNRIEAFSDGVMAILITIMVLELKAPHDPRPASLVGMWPTLFAYILSFVIIATYWVNHHYLIHLGSLIPWVTGYLGDITRCRFQSRLTPRFPPRARFRFSLCAPRSRFSFYLTAMVVAFIYTPLAPWC